MKKILLILLIVGLSLLGNYRQLEASLLVDATSEVTEYIEGVRHTKIVGEIRYYNQDTEETIRTKQVINYLGAHVQLAEELHVIVADAYSPYEWGMGNMYALKENIHQRYDHYQVIAGVNGDFYNMNTGHPVAGYIRNYEVLTTGGNRPLAGFKDNGEVVFGIPEWGGYELLVFDGDQDLKLRMDIGAINKEAPAGQWSVYFDDYPHVISQATPKVVLEAIDLKRDDWQSRYFGKGVPVRITQDTLSVEKGQIILVSDWVSTPLLFENTDHVVIQRKPLGAFEDVRFAIGVWEKLVENGRPLTTWTEGAIPTSRAPRTAIGVTAGGSVFFVTVDGRQAHLGMEGVNHREMAAIMSHFGARTAYNLDGGGSTTALVKDLETDAYHVVNHPSDGQLRNISNGLFIVKGHHQRNPDQLPFPDLRPTLETPKRIHIDDQGMIRFLEVSNSQGYQMAINGVVTTHHAPAFPLQLPPGEYEIRIRAIGDKLLFRSSHYSEPIWVTVHPDEIGQLFRLYRNSLRKETGN